MNVGGTQTFRPRQIDLILSLILGGGMIITWFSVKETETL